MITSVRRRANIESQTGFIPDAEIVEYLNTHLADLYDKLVQAGGQPRMRTAYSVSLVSGTDTYALPGDFYQLQSIDILISANQRISARPFMEYERNTFKGWNTPWTVGRPVYYRLQGDNIVFIPMPSASFTAEMHYYAAFQSLVNVGDRFDGVNGWEEYAIWLAVADCKGKGDEDPSYAMGRAGQLAVRIEGLAPQRDAGGAERVQDVLYDDSAGGMRGGF